MFYTVLLYAAVAVAALAIVVLAWLWYMGLLGKIHISLREVPEITIMFCLGLEIISSNMNYTGGYKDCCKGYADMERKTKDLLGELGDIPIMGSAYYTSPNEVSDPSKLLILLFTARGQSLELLLCVE